MIGAVHAVWPAPARVHAFTTTRAGGVSIGNRAQLNLGDRTGDTPERVAENRRIFQAALPSAPGWLRQVHGRRVLCRDSMLGSARENGDNEADAVWTRSKGLACTVLTADCLPVLFCDPDGTVVAAAHAGWRGLASGVLEATLAVMPVPPEALLAWIGPGIGVGAYEVGGDFRRAFRAKLPWLDGGFLEIDGRVHADLEAIARAILAKAGVGAVHGGGFCTYTEAERFYSHRRAPDSGRMATTIWIDADG